MQSGYTEDSIEGKFYRAFARTRCSIEQLFGIWKARFEVLSGTMRFRNPIVCGSVIMACGALQNFIMISRNLEENDDELFELEPPHEYDEVYDEEFYDEELEEEIVETNNAKVRLNKQKNLFSLCNSA